MLNVDLRSPNACAHVYMLSQTFTHMDTDKCTLYAWIHTHGKCGSESEEQNKNLTLEWRHKAQPGAIQSRTYEEEGQSWSRVHTIPDRYLWHRWSEMLSVHKGSSSKIPQPCTLHVTKASSNLYMLLFESRGIDLWSSLDSMQVQSDLLQEDHRCKRVSGSSQLTRVLGTCKAFQKGPDVVCISLFLIANS